MSNERLLVLLELFSTVFDWKIGHFNRNSQYRGCRRRDCLWFGARLVPDRIVVVADWPLYNASGVDFSERFVCGFSLFCDCVATDLRLIWVCVDEQWPRWRPLTPRRVRLSTNDDLILRNDDFRLTNADSCTQERMNFVYKLQRVTGRTSHRSCTVANYNINANVFLLEM